MMRKEYIDVIIRGIIFGVICTIPISLIEGKVAWTFLFTSIIFYPVFKLYINKRREAKKEEAVQRRE